MDSEKQPVKRGRKSFEYTPVRGNGECWIRRGKTIVDPERGLTGKDFISALKNQSDVAWTGVRDFVVKPVFNSGKFGSMVRDKGSLIDEAAALGYLFETLIGMGKIDNVRKPDSVVRFLESYVKLYIRDFYSEKEKRVTSIDDQFVSDKSKGEVEGEWPENMIPDDVQEEARKHALGDDERTIIQRNFHKLWKANPLKAYVLMFRMREHLKADEIRNLCKISSNGYVDKLFERAKNDMSLLLIGKPAVKRPKRKQKGTK